MLFKKRKHNILVLGSDGMLGYDVYNTLLQLSATEDSNVGTVIGIGKEAGLKLHERNALSHFMANSIHFDYCINCVAFTDTNCAENEDTGKILSYQLNALAPKYIAESCILHHTKLIHISTDYVFSELSDAVHRRLGGMFMPYSETFPVNAYGKDKLLGEIGVANAYHKWPKGYAILRTSWLYGMHNSKSFIHKFLKNAVTTLKYSKTHEVSMTENERSVPTSTYYLIKCILSVIDDKKYGTFHAVPLTNSYGVTRLQYAKAILDSLKSCENANEIGLSDIKLKPVKLKGHWPEFSAMANTIGPCRFWELELNLFLKKNFDALAEFMTMIAK